MKIRILTQNPLSVGFGGVEVQALKYIQNLKILDSSLDVDYFKWNEENFDILHIVGIHGGVNPYWIDVLKSKGVKIVVSSVFYIKPNNIFDFRRPIVYKLFSYIPFHVVNWMKQLVIKADIILPNSQDEMNQLISIFGVNSNKIHILHNATDVGYFNGIEENYFKSTYGLDSYILCVSHIEPRKNHKILIKGFLEYHKNRKSKLKLVILGAYRGNYFSYHKNIKEMISLNTDKILHLDNLKSSDTIFKSAYLGCSGHVLLSSLETPGLSNIEAALAGKKLILGDCLPVREYFGNYANYISPHKISENLSCIDKDSSINEQQREFIKNTYTWEIISEDLLKIYRNLGAQK